MAQPSVMSRDDLDEAELMKIAKACNLSLHQIEDVYACTPLQTSTMAESTIRAGATTYLYVLSIAASVDIARICAALGRVVELNTILRTRITDCRLGLVQVVTTIEHETQRLSGDVEQYVRHEKSTSMGLGNVLFRSAVINRKLVLSMYHGIHDNASLAALLNDVLRIYRGLAPEPHEPFKNFVKEYVGGEESRVRSFWAARFQGIPTIFPKVERGHVPHATQNIVHKIELKGIGDRIPLSQMPHFIETAWALTASAYTGSESVAFGLVLSGRSPTPTRVETTLGPMIATVPIQVNISRRTTVEGILKERATALRKIQHDPALQYGLPNIRTVSEAAETSAGFQALLNIRPPLDDPSESNELIFDYIEEPQGAFGLVLSCNFMRDGVFVQAMSDPAVLCDRQLRRTINQFEHTLRSLVNAPLQASLESLHLLNTHDLLELCRWNTDLPVPVDKCVHDIFIAQAQEQPNAPAVDASDGSLSYGELNDISDRLADELCRRGLTMGSTVAFIFEKSLWTVVTILGIMKAGGVCVPINKTDPFTRKSILVSAAEATTVLTSAAEHANSTGLASHVLAIDASFISTLPISVCRLQNGSTNHPNPEDLAYIIFTSGSTGSPKGVMLEHRGLATAFRSFAQTFGFQSDYRILQFAAHVWDISIIEMFGALLYGGCLCIPSEEDRESNIAGFIQSAKVNLAWFTPTVLRTLSPSDVPDLKGLVSTGEAISAEAPKTWGRTLHLFNAWGPCEGCIENTAIELSPDSLYPESAGNPIGCVIWIVNPRNVNKLVPIGAPGEIVLEGPAVARGYLRDTDKTAAAFIPPPLWAPNRKNKTTRFYRCGDIAKFYPDGSICLLGRQDDQVKIRGQRVELGEIESILGGYKEIRNVFMATKIWKRRTELVAVVSLAEVPESQAMALQELSGKRAKKAVQVLRMVRTDVKLRLPSFMVPTIWLAVEKIPRVASQKLDRRAVREWLRMKDLSQASEAMDSNTCTTLTAPTTPKQRLLQSVWSSVMSISEASIGCQSSFTQLGGDSILAMRVASQCRAHKLRVTMQGMLKGETLAACANSSFFEEPQKVPSEWTQEGTYSSSIAGSNTINSRLQELGQSSSHLRDENIERIVPATDAQSFMLAVGQAGGRGYHVELVLDFTPELNMTKIEEACKQVIQHHSILRTTFVQHGPALYQVVLKASPMNAVVIEKEEMQAPQVIFREGEARILAIFHLSPSNDGRCHRLRLEIHHALYDGISRGLILRDLDAAYAGKALSDGSNFQSWVSHVEALDNSTQREFWRNALQGSSMSYLSAPDKGKLTNHPLDKVIVIRSSLQNVQTRYGTASSTIKAVWALLLSSALKTKDVLFGEVSANRYLTFSRIDEVRGPCVNTVPVRARLDDEATMASFISQVQDYATASIPHHHLGTRSIIKDCTTWPPWMTRFSSTVAYQNFEAGGALLRVGDADVDFSAQGKLGDAGDIYIMATPGSDNLDIEIRYSSSRLPAKQVHWISRSLAWILEAIPFKLEHSLRDIKALIRKDIGVYSVPFRNPDLVNGWNKHTSTPSEEAQQIVSRAWEELEMPKNLFEDHGCSIFWHGSDMVTALLLAENYRVHGYLVSTEEIIRHPTFLMQANLIESKDSMPAQQSQSTESRPEHLSSQAGKETAQWTRRVLPVVNK